MRSRHSLFTAAAAAAAAAATPASFFSGACTTRPVIYSALHIFRLRYTLETVDLLACDFSRPAAAVSELRSAWEALSSPNDIKEEFSLSIKDISQAFATLSAAFGMYSCC